MTAAEALCDVLMAEPWRFAAKPWIERSEIFVTLLRALGFAIVPVEASPAMLRAADRENEALDGLNWDELWRAMVNVTMVAPDLPAELDPGASDGTGTYTRSMALLKLDATDGPVYFIMDHNRWHPTPVHGEDSDEANQEHQRYTFEEHSCPTNWIAECVAIIQNGDADPHGFLEFVRAADVPQDFDVDDDNQWPKLFPEAFEKLPAVPTMP